MVIDENIMIHRNDIDSAIYDACAELEIDDLKHEGQRPWKAVLMLVGKQLFPNTKDLKQKSNIYNNSNMYVDSNCNSYDYELLNYLCDEYLMLSNKYNKLVSIQGFSYLCNMSETTIELWKDNEPTSLSFKIWKKLRGEREQCLKDKCFDSNNVVGVISLGNTEYNWQTGAVAMGEKKQLKADALPDLSQGITPQIAQK